MIVLSEILVIPRADPEASDFAPPSSGESGTPPRFLNSFSEIVGVVFPSIFAPVLRRLRFFEFPSVTGNDGVLRFLGGDCCLTGRVVVVVVSGLIWNEVAFSYDLEDAQGGCLREERKENGGVSFMVKSKKNTTEKTPVKSIMSPREHSVFPRVRNKGLQEFILPFCFPQIV